MKVLRTPDERFTNLPDYAFGPNYDMLSDGLRLHFLDEGPRDGRVVLLMHGEPTWSYLYRKFVPLLTKAGCRVLAPDLIGFGRSDKPADRSAHTHEGHVLWMSEWLDRRKVENIVLFCQDWGGLIGLRLVARDPSRFAGVIASNTLLPEGFDAGPAFAQWLSFSQTVPTFQAGKIIQVGTGGRLSEAEIAAYDAPFPDAHYQAGPRQFPCNVAITPDHASVAENRAAWKTLESFTKPFITAFGAEDKITGRAEYFFRERIPGARGQPHALIPHAHHFIQENAPDELVRMIIELVRRTD